MRTNIRELLDTEKIQAKSCPEIRDGISDEAKRLRRIGMKWKYKLAQGPLINFLIAWYLKQPPGEREKIAEEGMAILTDILSHPYTAPGDKSATAPGPTVSKVDGRGGSARRVNNDRNTKKAVGTDIASLEVN